MGTEKRGAGATYQRQLNEICGEIKKRKWVRRVPPPFFFNLQTCCHVLWECHWPGRMLSERGYPHGFPRP